MITLPVNYRQNKYRYVTINVDTYTERKQQGRIWHEALKEEVRFGGWLDFMLIINQIYDRTNIPRRTLELRSFKTVEERELVWKTSEEEHMAPPPKGARMTFQILLAYRYCASWQGSIYCQEQNRNYEFTSFLALVRLMDSLLKGLEPEQPDAEQVRCSCQVAVNGCGESDMYGEIQNACNNWQRQFLNAAALIDDMLELHSDIKNGGLDGNRRIISRDTMEFYRKGGSKATFSVRILYQQNMEWQGYIYCRELRKEKAFRSFMELLYLMVSALDEKTAGKTDYNSSAAAKRTYAGMIG